MGRYTSPRSRRRKRKESPIFLLMVLLMMFFSAPFVYASITEPVLTLGVISEDADKDSLKELVVETEKDFGDILSKTVSEAEVEGTKIETAPGDSQETWRDSEGGYDENKESISESVHIESQESLTQVKREEKKAFVTVDESYFDDALFIGDSRTVGIMEYSQLKNASYFAENSMTAFSAMEYSLSVKGKPQRTLEELLEQERYGKIYVMLGINEVGYPFGDVKRQFQRLINLIREKQPESLLFIEANLHVTTERSQRDAVYNNKKIDELNRMMEEFTFDDDRAYYIDVNEHFDDASGGLREDYSSDSAHIYGKYYREWADWLCTKGVFL